MSFLKTRFVLAGFLMLSVFLNGFWITSAIEAFPQHSRLIYSRTELLRLRDTSPATARPQGFDGFCREVKPRKRGKRGGLRVRSRKRGTKPALPSMIIGNVRSLANKIDELETLTRYMHEYRETCLMGFSETWLNDSIPDSALHIPYFELVRGDRTRESGKTRGGGVCLYINSKWCQNWTVKDVTCKPDIELISVGLRPFYLP